jgi:glucose/arabinose dehydrogenase
MHAFRTLTFAALLFAVPGFVSDAAAILDAEGFRAVAVAHSRWPISAVAVAPDGRLFAAIQAHGRSEEDATTTAEIRVYDSYKTTDGALMDEGRKWADVTGVRASNWSQGLLGIAVAPDFAASGLVYVYLTTNAEDDNQHVRVYRDVNGSGQLVGAALQSIEPPEGNGDRNGAPLEFGVDGCLYLGVGDNGWNERWNSQLLVGTDPITWEEQSQFCEAVCTGPISYPNRLIAAHDGKPNHAGKILRLDVAGGAVLQPGPEPAFTAQRFAFATGLKDPAGLAVHPLTGQLWVAERGDSVRTELTIAERGDNLGWPCLEGDQVAPSMTSCIEDVDDVHAAHPEWAAPSVLFEDADTPAGMAAYVGLGYPAEYYGDLFYVMRDGARIYRVDLKPPCFQPTGADMTPLAFHDSDEDGDFRALFDEDGDGEIDNVWFQAFRDVVEAPNPQQKTSLYVAANQWNSNELDVHSVIFRIEFATTYTPYAGAAGRVADSCFAGLENPFARAACTEPGGPCQGQADGASCADDNPCNGAETCQGGVCAAGTPAADGSSCDGAVPCRQGGMCDAGVCVPGPPVADATPCPDGDPCNGLETCVAGVCTPSAGGPAPLDVTNLTVKSNGNLSLVGTVLPSFDVAPTDRDPVSLALRTSGTPFFEASLAPSPSWGRSKPPRLFTYKDKAGTANGVKLFQLKSKKSSNSLALTVKAKNPALGGVQQPAIDARLVVGEQCFETALTCSKKGAAMKCRP